MPRGDMYRRSEAQLKQGEAGRVMRRKGLSTSFNSDRSECPLDGSLIIAALGVFTRPKSQNKSGLEAGPPAHPYKSIPMSFKGKKILARGLSALFKPSAARLT